MALLRNGQRALLGIEREFPTLLCGAFKGDVERAKVVQASVCKRSRCKSQAIFWQMGHYRGQRIRFAFATCYASSLDSPQCCSQFYIGKLLLYQGCQVFYALVAMFFMEMFQK